MEELTKRQREILKLIVEEYVETAEPVGSEALEKKYELGVSPATIRNEMARLTKLNYLKQPHTSAGRMPTTAAFKFYVAELMEEKKLSVSEEVAAKEKIWDARFDLDKLMRAATRALAERTNALAVGGIENGDIYHSGYANILEMPEFFDIDITKTILSLLDENRSLFKLFEKAFGEGPIHLLLGEELGYDFLEPCGMVFSHFQIKPQKSGFLGVIGPCRFRYPRVIPTVRYFSNLVEELAHSL
jgi:transcriptional regulator of heat shock response